MFVDISEEKIVVIGGGTIGKRRLKTLLEFTEQVTLIDPEPDQEIMELAGQGRVELIKDIYRKEYVLVADMVVSATNS